MWPWVRQISVTGAASDEQPAVAAVEIALGEPAPAAPASPPATRTAPEGRAGSRARRRSAGTAADNASRRGRPSSSRETPAGPRSGSASPTPRRRGRPSTIVPAVHTCEKSVPSGRPLQSSVPCDGREQHAIDSERDDPGRRPRCGARVPRQAMFRREAPPYVALMPQKLNKSSSRPAMSCRCAKRPLYRLRNHNACPASPGRRN